MVKYLPFYMAYEGMQMPLMDEEWMVRRDYDYMKSTYPEMVKRMMPYVEEECDRMEYIGSMMFDEYPDQIQVRMMCRRIMEKVIEKTKDDMIYNLDTYQNNGLRDLIWVLTWQEILRRRSDYRKYRRKFY